MRRIVLLLLALAGLWCFCAAAAFAADAPPAALAPDTEKAVSSLIAKALEPVKKEQERQAGELKTLGERVGKIETATKENGGKLDQILAALKTDAPPVAEPAPPPPAAVAVVDLDASPVQKSFCTPQTCGPRAAPGVTQGAHPVCATAKPCAPVQYCRPRPP